MDQCGFLARHPVLKVLYYRHHITRNNQASTQQHCFIPLPSQSGLGWVRMMTTIKKEFKKVNFWNVVEKNLISVLNTM